MHLPSWFAPIPYTPCIFETQLPPWAHCKEKDLRKAWNSAQGESTCSLLGLCDCSYVKGDYCWWELSVSLLTHSFLWPFQRLPVLMALQRSEAGSRWKPRKPSSHPLLNIYQSGAAIDKIWCLSQYLEHSARSIFLSGWWIKSLFYCFCFPHRFGIAVSILAMKLPFPNIRITLPRRWANSKPKKNVIIRDMKCLWRGKSTAKPTPAEFSCRYSGTSHYSHTHNELGCPPFSFGRWHFRKNYWGIFSLASARVLSHC